jgi:leucyl aminopeptidase
VLHVTITVVPASGPSPLGGHIAASRESSELVDFAVVQVRSRDAEGGGTASGNGSGRGHGRASHNGGSHDLGDEAARQAVADPGAAELEPLLPTGVGGLLASYGASGAAGEVTEAPADLGGGVVRLMFVGTGDGSAAALRRAGAVLGRRVAGGKTAVAALPTDVSPDAVGAFTEGMLLGSYKYAFAAGGPADPAGAVRLLAAAPADPVAVSAAVARAAVVAGAVAFARDLINTPSARKSPQWLADQATELARRCGLRVRVVGGDELAAAGFGGIVAVGSGSSYPPRLIELGYEPAGWDTHVVLVGKGITFDSGGLSLKPADGMKLMKTDMAGGAAVMAAISALAAVGARVKVTGLVAAAENMPSGSAMRPGDVITHFGGRTVEVRNTDAEGRLVLADALAYADLTLDPDVIVDIATLTGAARSALGTQLAAMFTDDDDLAGALISAGEASGERLWRLPLANDYRDLIESEVADLVNIPIRRHGSPGAIAAALFLREFSGKRRWAHLDIAGPARSAADDGETTKGGTGFGTRVLLHWLAGL